MYSIEQGLSGLYNGTVFRAGRYNLQGDDGRIYPLLSRESFRGDDDRFLVKPTKVTKVVKPDANLELPLYDTAPLNAIDCYCFWKAVHAIQQFASLILHSQSGLLLR